MSTKLFLQAVHTRGSRAVVGRAASLDAWRGHAWELLLLTTIAGSMAWLAF